MAEDHFARWKRPVSTRSVLLSVDLLLYMQKMKPTRSLGLLLVLVVEQSSSVVRKWHLLNSLSVCCGALLSHFLEMLCFAGQFLSDVGGTLLGHFHNVHSSGVAFHL